MKQNIFISIAAAALLLLGQAAGAQTPKDVKYTFTEASDLTLAGKLFPDTDPAYEGADSLVLLGRVLDLARDLGFELVDADITVAAQNPKLSPYRDLMRERLAAAMGVDASCVGLKATTTERLGFVGREEGIEAWAVVLMECKGHR